MSAPKPLFLIFRFNSTGQAIEVEADGTRKLVADPVESEILRVQMSSSIRAWLTPHVWACEDDTRTGLRELRRLLDRLAAFVKAAAWKCSRTIHLASTRLRRLGSPVVDPDPNPADLRDLVAALRSPFLLAAGGGACLFVPRT